MTARELIESNMPVLDYSFTVEEALMQFEDADMLQLVLVEDEAAIGIVHKEDLRFLENERQKLSSELVRDKGVGLNARLHILDAAKTLAAFDLEIIPVLDDEMKFAGSLSRSSVLSIVTRIMGIDLPGTFIILRRLAIDYSMAEIARICESNECRIISSGIMLEEGSNALIVTLKIDRNELGGLISSFERYEYEVVASFGDTGYRNFLKERYDLLMNYLRM